MAIAQTFQCNPTRPTDPATPVEKTRPAGSAALLLTMPLLSGAGSILPSITSGVISALVPTVGKTAGMSVSLSCTAVRPASIRTCETTLVESENVGGNINFTNTSSQNAYLTWGQMRLRKRKSIAAMKTISTLTCHNIGHIQFHQPLATLFICVIIFALPYFCFFRKVF
jgi:hypothetical protein